MRRLIPETSGWSRGTEEAVGKRTTSRDGGVLGHAMCRMRGGVRGSEYLAVGHRRDTSDTWVTPGGVGMIHNRIECLHKARRLMEKRTESEPCARNEQLLQEAARVEDDAAEEAALSPPGPRVTRSGSELTVQQMSDKVSDARRGRVRACLRQECGECDEAPMVCRGLVDGYPCPSRLHGRQCAQLTKGHVKLGCFLCADCRLRNMDPQGDPEAATEDARRSAENAMLIELSSGAESTGASFADFKRLELEFMSTRGGVSSTSVLPTDNAEVFKIFLTWLVVEKKRARSLETLFRAGGSIMAKTRERNFTKDAGVKAFYNDLKKRHGEEPQPRTALTREMMRVLLSEVMSGKNSSKMTRERLLFAAEVMLGTRVGELLGGGDGHGMLANNLVILRKLDKDGNPTGEETVEGMIEHSKTSAYKRFVNALGKSRGPAQIELAKLLRDYWRDVNFTVEKRVEGGYQVEGPSYYVLRLSLVALTNKSKDDVAELKRLGRILKESGIDAKWADYVVLRGKQRMEADSFQKKYINIMGADKRESAQMDALILKLVESGFGGKDRLRVLPGPLFRSTHGAGDFTHMPLTTSSAYEPLHEYFDKAHALANAVTPDYELDLCGLQAPQWGHHSARRCADTVARHTMSETGATVKDIDIIFGWNQSMYNKDMQNHYESSFDRQRRCMVTSMM